MSRVLRDLLKKETVYELKERCKRLSLTHYSQYKKADLINILCLAYNDLDNLKNLFYFFTTESMNIFKKALNSDVKRTVENDDVFYMNLQYTFIFKDDNFLFIPDDLKDKYREFSKVSFQKECQKVHWMLSCYNFANDMYGIYKLDDLLKLLKLNRSVGVISKDEVIALNRKYDLARVNDDFFISQNAINIGIQELLSEQQGKEFYIPTILEIEQYTDLGYIYNNSYKRLKRVLSQHISFIGLVNSALLQLFKFTAIGVKVGKVISIVFEDIDIEFEEVHSYLIDAINNTNVIYNRGYTPIQLEKRLGYGK